MPPKYKLTYLPLTGRGEMIRFMFVAAGVEFEDDRINWDDWPKLKPDMPQHQLPVLEIDGKVKLCQSLTIARYIAREFNFYGKTPLEEAYIDLILETLQDLAYAARPYILENKQNTAKKAELKKKFHEEEAIKYVGFLENAIEISGKDGFAVGSSLTVADLTLQPFLEFLGLEYLFDKFPKVAASFKKVGTNEKIAKYMKERPANVYNNEIGP